MRWRRRREPEGGNPYADMREMALTLDPSAAGLEPSERFPKLFGVVMETGFPEGTATLVSLADGTTSLYLSSGGGTIGGGHHEAVAAASLALVEGAQDAVDAFEADTGTPLPREGRVIVRALAYDGRLVAEAAEDDLGEDRHPLSPVFHLAHDVITQLRLIDRG